MTMKLNSEFMDENPADWLYLECYEFNESEGNDNDDGRCNHCKKYLTLRCKRIHAFMDEIDD